MLPLLQSVPKLLLPIGFVLGASVFASQATAPAPPPDAPARAVKRTVLADGSIQFEFADGSRRVSSASSQSPGDADKSEAEKSENEKPESTAAGRGASADLMVAPPPAWLKDTATNEAFLQAMREYYAYRATGLQHRRRVFEWQLLSSRIIFVTVLMLVGSGIVFAALQFRAGLKRKSAGGSDLTTALDMSTTSIKVSSPVLGVIILVISLAFFYLYLVYVYPISELV